MISPVSTSICLSPTLVEREKDLMSPWRLSPSGLQVVVNRVRPGHGAGKVASVQSIDGGAALSRLGLPASVTNNRTRQVGRGTAAQDALVPLVGGPNKPAGARPTL